MKQENTKKHTLSQEEQELVSAVESSGLYRGQGISQQQKDDLSAHATYTLSKKKPINIRLLESDIYLIKRKSLQEGIPYQTLISSVIHKYARDTRASK